MTLSSGRSNVLRRLNDVHRKKRTTTRQMRMVIGVWLFKGNETSKQSVQRGAREAGVL